MRSHSLTSIRRSVYTLLSVLVRLLNRKLALQTTRAVHKDYNTQRASKAPGFLVRVLASHHSSLHSPQVRIALLPSPLCAFMPLSRDSHALQREETHISPWSSLGTLTHQSPSRNLLSNPNCPSYAVDTSKQPRASSQYFKPSSTSLKIEHENDPHFRRSWSHW